METKIISVISGKGGTGKSLFTAVLGNCLSKEHCKVLLVDMDIHVRGLTILLSKYIGIEKGMTVTDCLEKREKENNFVTYRFQECEILPAVQDINQPLKKGIESESIEFFLRKLHDFVYGKYDIVLLDCRSGLDDSLVNIVKNCDYIISVSEDDDVCLQSNLNLINYLRYKENINNIYTVINKGRRISKKNDIDKKLNNIFDFNCIGVIPFDEEIMDDYGKDRFWLTVYHTLYFYGLVKFWNSFREKTSIRFSINEDRHSSNPKKILYNNMSRLFKMYGYSLIIIGAIYPIISKILSIEINDDFSISLSILVLIGLLMILTSSGKYKRFLFGQDDEPEIKK